MANDRRRFLTAGVAGLAALLVPKLSFGGIFHRRRVAQTSVCVEETTAYVEESSLKSHACPAYLRWYTTTPASIPDANSITQNDQHTMSVTGTGLITYITNTGQPFYITITDDNYTPPIHWTPNMDGATVTPGNSGGPDTLTFTASETGSTPGVPSNITITIALTPTGACAGVWRAQPVTYS